ncbi:MAG: TIM barrel protein [Candidatus Hydrogenedentes bacterium]|nr:TIM barrel protein [Candidatus Hydrogenedentota bacterium]
MQRREFLKVAGTAAVAAASVASLGLDGSAAVETVPERRFKLKYAPHWGKFKNHAGADLIDQLKFMRDESFVALEDNQLPRKSVEQQEKIAAEMGRLGMEMGVFVALPHFNQKSFVTTDQETIDMVLDHMRAAVEVAKRANAKWCTVVPGQYDTRLAWKYQTVLVVELLKRCAEICEPSGLVMVLEPLNARRNHPGLFLSKISKGYQICKAVGSPSCKILDDLYHQQITEGNLIPNLDMAWSEIAYSQMGDNPGRKEPATGEINYRNIFKHIHAKGYTGIMGMEHGNSMGGKEGERAVIDAYIECDRF